MCIGSKNWNSGQAPHRAVEPLMHDAARTSGKYCGDMTFLYETLIQDLGLGLLVFGTSVGSCEHGNES
jgi:hypothetical protein